jgi:Cu(I)/Ag(I) efflux system membrane protein CusA/SilA
MNNLGDLKEAILEGSAQRIRPIFMTVCAITGGLLPIMWGMGTGATVMKRIAAPMVGGMISATALSLIVIPVIYYLWKSREIKRLPKTTSENQQITN